MLARPTKLPRIVQPRTLITFLGRETMHNRKRNVIIRRHEMKCRAHQVHRVSLRGQRLRRVEKVHREKEAKPGTYLVRRVLMSRERLRVKMNRARRVPRARKMRPGPRLLPVLSLERSGRLDLVRNPRRVPKRLRTRMRPARRRSLGQNPRHVRSLNPGRRNLTARIRRGNLRMLQLAIWHASAVRIQNGA